MKHTIKLTRAFAVTAALHLATAHAGDISVNGNLTVTNSSLNSMLGINTLTPSATVDVRPIAFANDQNGGIQMATTDGHWLSGMFLRTDSSGIPRLAFDIASGEGLTLLNGGNVGIGTTYPTAQLDVNGTVNASLFTGAGGTLAGSAGGFTLGARPLFSVTNSSPFGFGMSAGGTTAIVATSQKGNSAALATAQTGVNGTAVTTNGIGVFGQLTAPSGAAVEGFQTPSGVKGVLGGVTVATGGEFTTSTYYGVYGTSAGGNGPTSGYWAGYFDGDVNVNGNLTIGGSLTAGILASPLHVVSPSGIAEVTLQSGDPGSYNYAIIASSNELTIGKSDTVVTALHVNSAQLVSIGRPNSDNNAMLTVWGDLSVPVGYIYSQGVIVISDRNAKQNFTSITPQAVLDKVANLPITKWNFKADAGTLHIGPMAQDFHAAFQFGTDDKHINLADEGGVALAAIQGLNQRLNEKNTEIQDLKQTVNELKTMVQSLAEEK